MTPWLTVVTVVRDDPEGLRRTLASLAAQDLDGVDHVVVDSSADRDRVTAMAADAGLGTRYFWTEPNGVYPAMNLGLSLAAGDYVYFLNAGDSLHGPDVLGTTRVSLHRSPAQWAFGPVEVTSPDGTRTITPPWDYQREQHHCFSRGHFPPHQGTVVRTSLLREIGGFDTSYAIVADYAAFLRLSQVSDPLIMGSVMATFVEGGLSTRRWKASIAEFHRSRREILAPTGLAAWRESYETAAQFIRLYLVRDVLRRGRWST
jgi:putative colanic acid biosynthesis glycosyltransferase